MKTYRGGCHCGRVKFEIDGPQHLTALECNCSICRMSGFLHVIVRKEQFRLETDMDILNTYQFNTYNAQHIFCPKCGVKSFYIPRSHPDGFSINLRCLTNINMDDITIQDFDGVNWSTQIQVQVQILFPATARTQKRSLEPS